MLICNNYNTQNITRTTWWYDLCKEEYKKDIDKTIFPGIQGGPLEHVIAAKAVAFGEALENNFKTYQQQVVKLKKFLQKH